MRYVVLEIETGQDNIYHRYNDVTSYFEEEDIIDNNNYYSWKKGNNYQWYGEYKYDDNTPNYVVTFFENHPLFNCTILLQYQDISSIYTHKNSFTPCEVAEKWLYSLKKKRTRKKL